ncbi:hypothetical protein GLYMA_10G224451v4 [Glycine max]|nr:hypothetical protein GLYMA_10G224451v4 [Glycine max]KAH1139601.1 hypothetical protein GYH30_028805 [Glycine max]
MSFAKWIICILLRCFRRELCLQEISMLLCCASKAGRPILLPI